MFKKLSLTIVTLLFSMQAFAPVSYTHLDVYKRQLKEIKGNEKIVPEMEKDIDRLLLISDRFGKIVSTPHLEEKNIVLQVQDMMDYIKKRAGQNVNFSLSSNHENIVAHISPPVFDWVIENLLKNALDAMEGKGKINIAINQMADKIIIEVSDTGKGISLSLIHI